MNASIIDLDLDPDVDKQYPTPEADLRGKPRERQSEDTKPESESGFCLPGLTVYGNDSMRQPLLPHSTPRLVHESDEYLSAWVASHKVYVQQVTHDRHCSCLDRYIYRSECVGISTGAFYKTRSSHIRSYSYQTNMQHSCHFSQHPLAWDISMLEEHPFFAHPHPPPYDDSFDRGAGEPSKCEKKMHGKERAETDIEDDGHPETSEFGFGRCGGRGGRGFRRHFGPGHLHLHPREDGHEQEHGFNRWAGHEGPGLGHHHHHHHKRGGPGPHSHPWGMFRELGRGRGAGGRCGRGFRHPFYNFHHMHPRFRSFYHSHDATSLTHDATSFTPPVDIFVTDTQTIIHASLPGAQRSDLSVAYDASRSILRMAGVVHRPGVDEEMYQALLVGERGRHVGVFEREVPISHNVAVEGVEARLVDGVLRVTLPRVEGEVQQPDEEMDEVEKEGAREESWVSSECTIEGKEQEEHEEEEEVEREYVKVDIQ